MLLGTFGASLLGNLLTGMAQLEQVKGQWQKDEDEVQLEQVKIVNATPFFN